MVSPMPKYRYKSVLDISVEDLHKMGAKAVALDIDNTICNDGRTNCIDGLPNWLKKIQDSGIKVMIISNAMPRRPKIVSKALSLPYIASAKKPKPHTLIQGAEMMGVKINELAMVGDQIFADVMAANNCGAIAMVGGLIIVPIVSLLTKKTLPNNIDDKFCCYEQTVVTNKKDSLG